MVIIPRSVLTYDVKRRLFKTMKWTSGSALLFSDEAIEWLKEFAPDAVLQEFIRSRRYASTPLYEVTENHWKIPDKDIRIEMSDDSYLLFKLTWL